MGESQPSGDSLAVTPSEELLMRSEDRNGFRTEYPFESRWARINGRTVHYIDEGTGPAIVCVHGNPTWSFAWRNVVDALSSEYRIIAVDHLGCGFSEKGVSRDELTLGGHIERLNRLLDLLNPGRFTLVGHDWGGAIGMGVAGSRPGEVASVCLMNTGAYRSTRIPGRIAVCRVPLLGAIGVRGLNLFSAAAVTMASEKGLSPAARAGLTAPYDSWKNRQAVHEFVLDIPLKPSHRSYEQLATVEAGLEQFSQHPITLIWGMKDWCFTPEFLSEFQKRWPHADVRELADCGHYVFEDDPAAVIAAVRDAATAGLNFPASA